MNKTKNEEGLVPDSIIPILEWLPTDDRMLVRRLEIEKRSPGGIIIPETAQEKGFKGIVLACGPQVALDENFHKRKGKTIQIGDVVLFGKYAGTEIEVRIEGKMEEILIMRETDIIAIRKTNVYDLPSN